MIINTSMYPEMMGFITDVVVIEEGKNLTFGPVEEVYAEALCKSPVRMHILAQMEKALEVLKENHLVDRVTVDGDDVIFRFNGGEKEEAELLTDREAQPGAAVLVRRVGRGLGVVVEQLGDGVFRDADAGVGDLDLEPLVLSDGFAVEDPRSRFRGA